MKSFKKITISLCLLAISGVSQAAITSIPQSALNSSPGAYTPDGYYTQTLGNNIITNGSDPGASAPNLGQTDGRNDDGFMSLALGFNFTFFGTTYSELFINNNGNVSFTSGISAYDPVGPTGAAAPIISPYFADVDTRNLASDVVYYNNLASDELVVTWNNVGYFNSKADKLNSFQLVLRSDDYVVPVGEGKIGFFYQNMEWTNTDTSTTAAVGFGDGAGNGEALVGSSSDPTFNSVVNDKYLWFNENREVVSPSPVSAPSTIALFGLSVFGLAALRRRKAIK